MEESQTMTNQIDQDDLGQDSSPTDSTSFEDLSAIQNPAGQGYPGGDLPVEDSPVEGAPIEDLPAETASSTESEPKLENRFEQVDFDSKVKYDESKEQVIERLHRELQFYREGLDFRLLQPIFMDLIMLHDDMDKLLVKMNDSSMAASNQMTQMAQYLKVFQESVEEILQRNGVKSFTTEEEVFLPGRQRSLRVIPTADPILDKHIVRRVRKGFEYEDKLLRHELVEVYKHTPIPE